MLKSGKLMQKETRKIKGEERKNRCKSKWINKKIRKKPPCGINVRAL